MIDTTKWSEFHFCDVFTVKRGDRLTRINQIPGNIAYISSSKNNNGIDNYILPPDNMEIFENCLTLSNSGSIGYCFYHPYKFVSSDHCTVIKIKDSTVFMDFYIGLFLKPVIESMKHKYGFSREMSNDRLKKEKIILPVTNKGKVDWNFIKNFMIKANKTTLFSNPSISIIKNKTNIDLKTISYDYFIIGKTFEIISGQRLIKIDRISGNIPYYSASDYNNGLTDMIGNPLFIENDALVYSTFGQCYYVEGEFTASDEISILKNSNLNLYNGLFVATIISQSKYKYSFGRKAFANKFLNEVIQLPIDKTGQPDWQFMENYIKSLPYSANL